MQYVIAAALSNARCVAVVQEFSGKRSPAPRADEPSHEWKELNIAHLQSLENQRCTCVRCPDCSGNSQSHVSQDSRIAIRIADAADIEACPTCLESGIVKTCARCEEIDYILKSDALVLEGRVKLFPEPEKDVRRHAGDDLEHTGLHKTRS